MKKITLCFFYCLFQFPIFAQSNWVWVAPDPPQKRVYSAVKVDNRAYLWCEDNSVIKLDLNSERFEMMPMYTRYTNYVLGDFTEQGIAFADSLTGYITDASKGEFRTTDGGKSWTFKSSTGSSGYLVTFVSKSRGWKLGYNGFFMTDDGGQSWSPKTYPPAEGYGYFSKIFALNQNQIWVLRNFHYQGNEGSIYYSSNAGNSWRKINTGLFSGYSHQVRYTDFKMNPSGIGFAIGNITKPDSNIVISFIQRTTDMGVTWSIIEFREGIYKNIVSISDSEWIFLGHNPGVLYMANTVIQRKTTDMGNTWSFYNPVPSSYGNSFFYSSVYSEENNTIYLFTLSGFYKSSDKGETYQRISSEKDMFLSNVVFDSKPINADDQLGIAYIKWYKNNYLITTDCGYTWQKKSLPSEYAYIWDVGVAENVIYMIVEQTKIIKSTDFGETWVRLIPPFFYSGFQSLSVYDKDILVFSGYENLISSSNGGVSWTMGPLLSNIFFRSIDIFEPGKVIGGGTYFEEYQEKGFFYNTTDYGLSWHIIDFEKQIDKVQLLNDRLGLALSYNQLLKTTNFGSSWYPILHPYENSRFDNFIFKDSLKGIVNEKDIFHLTLNGGFTWTRKYLNVPIFSMTDMAFNSKGDLFLIGSYSLVMLPFTSGLLPGSIYNIKNDLIAEFALNQNYPNPFNPSTKISWQSPVGSWQTLKVYDLLGNEVATLVDEYREAGKYEIEFPVETNHALSLPSGVYFYQLKVGNYVETKKMILLR